MLQERYLWAEPDTPGLQSSCSTDMQGCDMPTTESTCRSMLCQWILQLDQTWRTRSDRLSFKHQVMIDLQYGVKIWSLNVGIIKLSPFTVTIALPRTGTQTGSMLRTAYVKKVAPTFSNWYPFELVYTTRFLARFICGTRHWIVAMLMKLP